MSNLKLLDKYKLGYNWATILVGLKLDVIQPSDVSAFAERHIATPPQVTNDSILELAWTNNSFERATYLIETMLRSSNLPFDIELERRKWRYCILKQLRDTEVDENILVRKLAVVYSDFDYPEDMERFIYYLEPRVDYDPKSNSYESNIERLVRELDLFLEKEMELCGKV